MSGNLSKNLQRLRERVANKNLLNKMYIECAEPYMLYGMIKFLEDNIYSRMSKNNNLVNYLNAKHLIIDFDNKNFEIYTNYFDENSIVENIHYLEDDYSKIKNLIINKKAESDSYTKENFSLTSEEKTYIKRYNESSIINDEMSQIIDEIKEDYKDYNDGEEISEEELVSLLKKNYFAAISKAINTKYNSTNEKLLGATLSSGEYNNITDLLKSNNNLNEYFIKIFNTNPRKYMNKNAQVENIELKVLDSLGFGYVNVDVDKNNYWQNRVISVFADEKYINNINLSEEEEESEEFIIEQYEEEYGHRLGKTFIFAITHDQLGNMSIKMSPLSFWENKKSNYVGNIEYVVNCGNNDGIPNIFEEIVGNSLNYDNDAKEIDEIIDALVNNNFKFSESYQEYVNVLNKEIPEYVYEYIKKVHANSIID